MTETKEKSSAALAREINGMKTDLVAVAVNDTTITIAYSKPHYLYLPGKDLRSLLRGREGTSKFLIKPHLKNPKEVAEITNKLTEAGYEPTGKFNWDGIKPTTFERLFGLKLPLPSAVYVRKAGGTPEKK